MSISKVRIAIAAGTAMSTAFIGVTVEQVQEEFSQFNITNITDFHGYISPSAAHPGQVRRSGVSAFR